MSFDMMTTLWRNGPVLLTLTMLFWSGSVVVGRAAADLLPPVLFTLLRWAAALLIVVPLGWARFRADLPALWARRWTVLLLAVIGTCAYNILVYRGLHRTTAVNGLLMQSVMPLAILLVELLAGERPGWRQAVAIFVSIAGVVVIAAEGSLATLMGLGFNPGDVSILVAVVAYAVYSVMLRRRPAVHAFSLLIALFGVGVVVLSPLAMAEYAAGARLVPALPALLAVLYAGVFASFLATLCYNRGLELVGAARGGQYAHLMPVFGVLLAMAFLGERLHPYHAVGIGLIGAGLALARRR